MNTFYFRLPDPQTHVIHECEHFIFFSFRAGDILFVYFIYITFFFSYKYHLLLLLVFFFSSFLWLFSLSLPQSVLFSIIWQRATMKELINYVKRFHSYTVARHKLIKLFFWFLVRFYRIEIAAFCFCLNYFVLFVFFFYLFQAFFLWSDMRC